MPTAPLSNTLPVGEVSTTVKLPSVDELDQQIADLQRQMLGLPTKGFVANSIGVHLKRKLIDLQRRREEVSTGGVSTAGIPPAPDSPGSFSNQIATPLVGLEDLTIPI